MAMFSESGMIAARVICPQCKQSMEYIEEDHFFRCPRCESEFHMPDKTLPCPGCSQPMKYFPPGCYRCPDCDGEYWPGEETKEDEFNIWRDPDAPMNEPQEELKGKCYQGGQIVFTGSKSGKSRQKKPKKAEFSNLFSE